VPSKLSAAAREHLEAYAAEVGETIADTETVVEKVRDFFKGKRRGRGKPHADEAGDGEKEPEDKAVSA